MFLLQNARDKMSVYNMGVTYIRLNKKYKQQGIREKVLRLAVDKKAKYNSK